MSLDVDMCSVKKHTLEMMQMADAGGFEIVGAAEHYGIEMTIAPNPFQIPTWFTAHTERIRLGTAVVIAVFRASNNSSAISTSSQNLWRHEWVKLLMTITIKCREEMYAYPSN